MILMNIKCLGPSGPGPVLVLDQVKDLDKDDPLRASQDDPRVEYPGRIALADGQSEAIYLGGATLPL